MLAAGTLLIGAPAAAGAAEARDDDGFGAGAGAGAGAAVSSSDVRTSDRAPAAGTGGTFEAAAAGAVTGQLFLDNGTSTSPVVIGSVEFYYVFEPTNPIASVDVNVDGTFTVTGLPAQDYRVAFISRDAAPLGAIREWAGGSNYFYGSSIVTLAESTPYDFGAVTIGPRGIETSRLAGADRFATAGALAEFYWGTGIGGTVFIVNGRNFPDALSAGAAATNGVLLMVETNSVPSATAAQLARIEPDRIVVVGGTGVVSNGVLATLRTYVDDPADVVRISGADRYATSRAVITSPDAFDGNVTSLLIATGRNFPDALAAVPAAISTGAGVLLVNGAASGLDAATEALVDALGVPVYIIGGTGVVSSGIFNDLDALVPTTRVSGDDRFETSVEVAIEFFPAADYAFIANGFGFADALAAGPVAGGYDSPTYLVRKECVPNVVFIDIFEVLANEVVTVGGTGVVSTAAEGGTPCDPVEF